MKLNKKICAIILNWNNYPNTRDCIESLRRSSCELSMIILIDNNSQDDSLNKLKRDYSDNEKIAFFKNDHNMGFAKGVNVGIKRALEEGVEFIILVNNDAVLDENCIAILTRELNSRNKSGLAGPLINYYYTPKKIWQAGGRFSKIKSGLVIPYKNKSDRYIDFDTKEVSFLSGCVLMIKRELLDTIGLFDENFFFYGEDLDLCLRTASSGYKILFVPQAKALHKVTNIAKDRTSEFVMYNLAKSTIICIKKHFSKAYLYYALFMQITVYSFYRLWQISRGTRSINSYFAWIKGIAEGFYTKINE